MQLLALNQARYPELVELLLVFSLRQSSGCCSFQVVKSSRCIASVSLFFNQRARMDEFEYDVTWIGFYFEIRMHF